MADSYTRQGRYADAETYYRQVIEKNPKDAVAMNNLALLLALQGVKLDEALKLRQSSRRYPGTAGAGARFEGLRVSGQARAGESPQRHRRFAKRSRRRRCGSSTRREIYSQLGQDNSARTAMFKAVQMGLTKDMLQPPELPAYEKLRQLAEGEAGRPKLAVSRHRGPPARPSSSDGSTTQAGCVQPDASAHQSSPPLSAGKPRPNTAARSMARASRTLPSSRMRVASESMGKTSRKASCPHGVVTSAAHRPNGRSVPGGRINAGFGGQTSRRVTCPPFLHRQKCVSAVGG